MFQIVTALTPIFLLIFMGWGFRRLDFPGEAFWPMAGRITYYVFFPALLFSSLYSASFDEMHFGYAALTITLSMILVSTLMLALRRYLKLTAASYSSFFQGGLRPNTYVGISAAYVLYGSQGLVLAALVIAVMIPLSNLISVAVVSLVNANEPDDRLQTIKTLLHNPMITACFLGIVANLSGISLGFGAKELITVLSQASMPLGLLSVGAGLRIGGLVGDSRVIALASAIKLLLLPLSAAGLAMAFGLEHENAVVVVIFTALPCGPAAYVLARQLGGDTLLMAEIITIQTLAAFLTMPLMLGIL
ncbi:AEC family transporter [Desulfonatronum parangueonense]